MKAKFRLSSPVSAVALALTAGALIFGLVWFSGLSTPALVGGLVAACVLACAFRDYSH